MPNTDARSPEDLEDIGLSLSRQSRYKEAYTTWHQARALRSVGKESDYDLLWCNNLHGLGLRLLWDEHYADAETYLRESLDEKEKESTDGIWTCETRVTLARALSAQQKWVGAECLLRSALRTYLAGYGERHEKTLQVTVELAVALSHQDGKVEEAEALVETVLRVRKGKLGDVHQETLESVWLVASITEKLQKSEKTLRLYEKAYAGAKQLLGEQHADTKDYWSDFVRVRKQLKGV